ncbi:MAG: 3'-5' exonuclease [Patescibacteria group bacterium]|jgi:hypothetical protein
MHIMVDLETVAKIGKVAFFSLGAVVFDPLGPPVEYPKTASDGYYYIPVLYELINLEEAINSGLEMDADTIYWWMNQNELVKQEFVRSQKEGRDPRSALCNLRGLIKRNDGQYLWSHGSDFDIAILRTAFFVCGLGHNLPIPHGNFRDTRTLFAVTPDFNKEEFYPAVPPENEHHALFDAWRQAVAVQRCYQRLRECGIHIGEEKAIRV